MSKQQGRSGGDARSCAYTIPETGQQCRAYAMHGYDFCFHHEASVASARAAAKAAGGRKGSTKVLPAETEDAPLDTVSDVKTLLGQTINQIRRGELDVKTSNAVGYLAGILLKCIETGDLQTQLDELRQMFYEQNSTTD